ncbi:hypothetical protein [Polyangium jinanense]|uniref:Uncharacterized protein n=1 Tax=Polyangium jinanense TaxID=2829994 RepID=A0A9X3X074_9BACT|nr:hypothetical protein [Polyangium jinanense]MDC3953069.1 hypothetical protein [Polyangium jinanense]MDC3979818.1 hypothetical protein [Polyangium jinanense]
MWWLWIVAPIAAGLIFVLTGQVDKRALSAIEAWRDALGARRTGQGKARAKAAGAKKKKGKDTRPKRVGNLPPVLGPVAELAGGGKLLGDYEIVPKVAYARFVQGDVAGSSDHQTVIVALEEAGPAFTARPLLVVDGKPAPNTGIQFRKHPEFMEAYVVEGSTAVAKAIGKWLTRPLRDLLCESGEVWVRVEGKAMALSIYGTVREEKIAALLEIADLFVAEHGAAGGPSLFGEDEETRAARLAEDESDDEDESDLEDDEDEDEDEEEDDEEEEPAKPAAKAPAKSSKSAKG